jgi:ribosomal protein L11 methyltransferase
MSAGPENRELEIVVAARSREAVDRVLEAVRADAPALARHQGQIGPRGRDGQVLRVAEPGLDALLAVLSRAADTVEAETGAEVSLDVLDPSAAEAVAGTGTVAPCSPVAGITVYPREDAGLAGPGDIVLDPGRAFGSGRHPSTRLALELMHKAARRRPDGLAGVSVLDVGCGTGLLGLAACRLGAASVLGLDVCASSAATTRDNAAANRLEDRVRVVRGSLEAVSGAGVFDLVLANLAGAVLFRLAPDLPGLAAPNSALVASGFFAPQAGLVRRMFEDRGLAVCAEAGHAGWAGLLLEPAG